MPTMWDERFASDDFVYGLKPNQFYKSVLDLLQPGDILIPGEGEGRNALYAAQQGWKVHAFDTSAVGREKALALATKNDVEIQYDLNDYIGFQTENKYDAIALIFTHLPSSSRPIVHNKYASMLKPGGSLIMQTFDKEQLGLNSGGPKSLDLLFSIDELEQDFQGLQSFSAQKEFIELDEGPFHQGKAHVISARGIK